MVLLRRAAATRRRSRHRAKTTHHATRVLSLSKARRSEPPSLEQNLGHHSLVLVIEEVAMEHRHAANHRICEVHDDVDRAANRYVDGVQPLLVRQRAAVLEIGEEMDLMNLHRVQLTLSLHPPPTLIP